MPNNEIYMSFISAISQKVASGQRDSGNSSGNYSDDSVILNQMEEASEQIPLMTTQNPSIEKLTEEISKMEFEMRRKSKEIKVMKSTEKVTRTKESFQKIESPRRRE